jgi:hypothetical protein
MLGDAKAWNYQTYGYVVKGQRLSILLRHRKTLAAVRSKRGVRPRSPREQLAYFEVANLRLGRSSDRTEMECLCKTRSLTCSMHFLRDHFRCTFTLTSTE